MSPPQNLTHLSTRLIESAQDWQHFDSLLRTYAANDLDQPHLSSIWKDLESLPARYGPPHGAALLLIAQNQSMQNATVIGCGALASTQLQGACEIKRLFIQPAFRGQGGSKVLIRDLLKKGLAEGYDQAVLSTWQSNSTGLALYQALGFLPVPSFKSHPNSELIFLGRSLGATDAQTSP
jgi:ribosomal protein S18 acetylase RimI-like enzyme